MVGVPSPPSPSLCQCPPGLLAALRACSCLWCPSCPYKDQTGDRSWHFPRCRALSHPPLKSCSSHSVAHTRPARPRARTCLPPACPCTPCRGFTHCTLTTEVYPTYPYVFQGCGLAPLSFLFLTLKTTLSASGRRTTPPAPGVALQCGFVSPRVLDASVPRALGSTARTMMVDNDGQQ